MSQDPQKIFPDEVLDLQKSGVPLPTWFSGPLYTGNGGREATEAIIERREDADAPIVDKAGDPES